MKTLFILNEPTPYFTPDLDSLAKSIQLDVVYCEDSFAPQGWGQLQLKHPHRVVGNGLRAAIRVMHLLITNDYEAVVSFSFRRTPRLFAFAFTRVTGTTLVVRTDTSILDIEQDSVIKRRLRRLIMRRFIPARTRIWTIGTNNARFWSEEFDRHNQVLIPYEVGRLPGGGTSGSDRCSDPNFLRIVYVGRLVEVKRTTDLLDAVRLLDGKGLPDWELRVVGTGPLAEELKSRTDDVRIKYLGAIPYDDLAEIYKWADVLVLPSVREPWGLVVNEALGFGVRVVTSDRVGCAPDLINDSNGAIYRVGDVQALAAELIRCRNYGRPAARRPSSNTADLMLQDLRNLYSTSRQR